MAFYEKIEMHLHIKLKVLDACTVTTLLYNSETWGNANLQSIEVSYRKLLKVILGVKNNMQ